MALISFPAPRATRWRLATKMLLLLVAGYAVQDQAHAQTIIPNVQQGCINAGANSVLVNFTLDGVPNGCNAIWHLVPGHPNVPACPELSISLGEGCYDLSATVNGIEVSYGSYCVYKRPVPSFTASMVTNCTSATITLEDTSDPGSDGAEIASYTWYPDIGNVGNGQFVVTSSGNLVPTLQVVADNGCANIGYEEGDLISVVLNEYPTAVVNGPAQSCNPPVEVPFNATGSSTPPGTGPLSYAWTVNGVPTDPVISFGGTGTYEVCVAATNSIGCTATACSPIEIFDEPVLSITGPPGSICAGQPVQFAVDCQPPPPPGSIVWDRNCDNTNDGSGPVWNGTLNANDGSICARVSFSASCTPSVNLPITVEQPPQAVFTPSDTIWLCGDQVPQTFDVQNPDPGVTYTWRVNGVTAATGPSFTSTFSSGTVQLTATSATGCEALSTAHVIVEQPLVVITAPIGVCAGGTFTSNTWVDVIAGEEPFTYAWTLGSWGTSTSSSPTWTIPPGVAVGQYPLCVTVTTSSGCVASRCRPVAVRDTLSPLFTPDTIAQCIGQLVNFQPVDPTGTDYTWTITGAGQQWTIDFPDVTQRFFRLDSIDFEQFADPNGVVCFNVNLMINNDGCERDTTIENALCLWGPMANFDFTRTCGNPLTVSFQERVWAADSLTWDFGDGTILGGPADDPNMQAPVHTYQNEGTYQVCLTASADTSQCPDVFCRTFYVDVPSANLSISPTEGCAPLCVQFSPNNEPYNTHWNIDFGNGTTVDAAYGAGGWVVTTATNGVNSPSVTIPGSIATNFLPGCITYDAMQQYSVVAQATNDLGCTADTTYENVITVSNNAEFATFTYAIDATNACDRVCIDLLADNAMDTYAWSYRTSTLSPWLIGGDQQAVQICAGPPRPTQFEVLLAGEMGNCSDTRTQTITIPALPTAAFTGNSSLCKGDVAHFTAVNTGLPPAAYQWRVDNGPITNGPTFQHPFTANGTYEVCLQVTDPAYGCVDQECRTVVVYSPEPDVLATTDFDPVHCTFTLCVQEMSECVGCNYQWTFTNAQTGESSNGQNFAGPICRTFSMVQLNVQLRLTAPNGCYTIWSAEDVFGLADVLEPWTATSSDEADCAPHCFDFTAYDTQLPGYSYSWAFGDPCDGSGAQTPVGSHCYTCPGSFCPTLQLRDANGCYFEVHCVTPIVVREYKVEAMAQPQEICFGDSALLTVVPVDPQYGLDFIDVSPAANLLGGPPWYINDNVTVTAHYAQCSDEVPVELLVRPLPEIGAEPYGPFCRNDGLQPYPVVTPIPPPGSATWSGPPAHPFALEPTAHSLTYRYTNEHGCTDSVVVPFTVNDTALVLWHPELLHACANDAPVPLATLVDHAPALFEVDYGDGWEAATFFDLARIAEVSCEVQVPVRCTYENIEGCKSTVQAFMSIHPLPQAALQVQPATICLGDPMVALDASTIGCGGVEAWTWHVDGILFGTTAAIGPHVFPDCGTHQITLMARSAWGCTNEVQQDVVVHCLPELAAAPYGPFCNNDGYRACPEVSPAPGTGNGYAWTPVCPVNPSLLGSGEHAITYHYTDLFGCTDSLIIPFTVNDTTAVRFIDSLHVCAGAAPVALQGFPDPAFPGGDFQVNYYPNVPESWVNAPDGVFNPDWVTVLPCPVVDVPVRYRYTNAVGCVSHNDSTIQLHPLPNTQFTAPDVCAYDSLVVLNTSTIGCDNIVQWSWNIADVGQYHAVQAGPFASVARDVAISLTAVTNYGCSATYRDTSTVHPVPIAAFSAPATCQFEPVQYTDQSAIPGAGQLSWDWRFADGTTDPAQHPLKAWTLWGEHTDTLIVRSTFGCSDTTWRAITIHPAPVNGMAFGPNCFGAGTPLLSTSSIPLGSIDSTWWQCEGPTGPVYPGASVMHTFSSSPPFHHAIALFNRSDMGCLSRSDTTIEIWPLPQVDFMLSAQEICATGNVLASELSSVPLPYQEVAWAWMVNGAPAGNGPQTLLAFPDSGDYRITLITTTANGCQDSSHTAQQVIVHPLPVAGFTANPAHTDLFRTQVQVTDASSGAVAWAYQFGDGAFSNIREPAHLYATFGTYRLQQVVSTAYDCTDTAYALVVVDPELIVHVPNTFTPDGDGVNDYFIPVIDGFDVRDYLFSIWDRWGECIFRTSDKDHAWDGRLNGELVKNDVYVWQLELRAMQFATPRLMRGHVTVLR